MFRTYHNRKSALVALGVFFTAARCVLAGDEIIDLALNAASPTINEGDTVEVALITHAVNPESLAFAGVQIILDWDPSVLRLAGVIENEAPDYVFLQPGFPDDSGLDGLNNGVVNPGDIPDNDGNAFYNALGQLGNPPITTATGLQVTRFLFEAIDASPLTEITMPLTFGQFTETAVFSATTPGLNILGEATGAQIVVIPEPATAAFLLLLSTGFVRFRRGVRVR